MLKKMKIKNKMYFSALVSLIFIIFIGGGANYTINTIVNKAIPLSETLSYVKGLEGSLENSEKSFIINDVGDEEFFKNNTSKNITEFQNNYKLIIKSLDFLISSKIIQKNPDDIERIKKSKNLFKKYNDIVTQNISLEYRRGFKDYGLIGEFNRSVHKIEEDFTKSKYDKFKMILLKMEKSEKNYFKRGEVTYLDDAVSASNELITLISSTDYELKDEEQIIKNLKLYTQKLNELKSTENALKKNLKEKEKILKEINSNLSIVFENINRLLKKSNKGSKDVILFLTIAAIIVFIGLQTYISKLITKPIEIVTKELRRTSNFDLTYEKQELEYITYDNEIGVMTKSLSQMKNALKDMAGIVKRSSNKINSGMEKISTSSEEISLSSKSISEAVSIVSNNNEISAEQLNDISFTLDKLKHSLDEMFNKIKDIGNGSKQMHNMAQESNQEMEKTKESVGSVEKMFLEFAMKINKLATDISEISIITDTLNEISERTNLLALNASIEAARAGEQGRGFSIVAEEVRKLAEQSKESSDQITTLVNNISGDAVKIIEGNNNVSNELKFQFTGISSSIEAFGNILREITESTSEIQSLSELAKAIETGKNIIIEKVNSISDFAKTNSASSQEVSASIEELTISIEQISQESSELNQMTQDMLGYVDKFKI